MKKGMIIWLVAVLSVLIFTTAALADWKETDRDKWRIIYIDDEIVPTGQDTFAIREKKEYVTEGASCSCTPIEEILSYDVDAATCKVQRYAMEVLDHDGNVLSSQKGEGEIIPNNSLVPYCKIVQVLSAQTAKETSLVLSAGYAMVSRSSMSAEPLRP
jgi:hypothetical protein